MKEVNLFDFDDDEPVATAAPAAPSLMSGGGDGKSLSLYLVDDADLSF